MICLLQLFKYHHICDSFITSRAGVVKKTFIIAPGISTDAHFSIRAIWVYILLRVIVFRRCEHRAGQLMPEDNVKQCKKVR